MLRSSLLAFALLLSTGCVERASLQTPPAPQAAGMPGPSGGAVELHLRDGRLVLLDRWEVVGNGIRGPGRAFGIEREPLQRGNLDIPLSDVALMRTRQTQPNLAVVPMAAVTAVSAVVSVVCIATEKACFGSCPTFYVPGEHGDYVIQAEGFSSSVAKILESDDLDDLPDARAKDGAITMAVRNESLETHMIRELALEVVRGPEGSTVLRGFRDGYLATGPGVVADSCSGPDIDGDAACRSR
jgi:hypothetical protein